MLNSVSECLTLENPLSDEVIKFLLNYQEEDMHIDFKLSFDNEEREWLEITKDILAFSNTFGGYLVFGIKNGTFEKQGLSDEEVKILRDANNLIQKVNRFIEPNIKALRCKHLEYNEKSFVIVFIPPSLDITHIINKDAFFKFPSGKEKVVIRQGTTFVRRSGGNHLMDDRDLDDIIARRINYYKNSLLKKISRVVEAPPSGEIFVISGEKTDGEYKEFIIENAPDAIPVKGMSFTISPKTLEQEIMGWIAMNEREREALPASAIVWKWYKDREEIKLTHEQKVQTAKYSLLTGVPAFYWLQGCDATSIKKMLIEALTFHPNISSIGDIVSTGAFLGKRFHKNLVGKLGEFSSRIAPAKKTIPGGGVKVLFRADNIVPKGKLSKTITKNNIEKELTNILSGKSKDKNFVPTLQNRWRAQALDCYLYAQDDQYIVRSKK